MRRNNFSMPTHHKVMSKTEQEEEEEEGTEGQFLTMQHPTTNFLKGG